MRALLSAFRTQPRGNVHPWTTANPHPPVEELGTVNIVYFEGGEPFLFYPLLLEGLRMARTAGLEDGLHWLRPIRDLGVVDFSVSNDEFHRVDKNDRRAEFARQAAQQLGIPTATLASSPTATGRLRSKLSKLDYVPDVAVVGGYAYQSIMPSLPSDFSYVGLMGNYTLFDFGKREHAVKERNAQVAMAETGLMLTNPPFTH